MLQHPDRARGIHLVVSAWMEAFNRVGGGAVVEKNLQHCFTLEQSIGGFIGRLARMDKGLENQATSYTVFVYGV